MATRDRHAQAGSPAAPATTSGNSSRTKTRKQLFLRSNICDLALTGIVSACLVFIVSYGFYSAPEFRGNLFLDLIAALPFLLMLYAGAWSKRAVAFSAIGYVLLSVFAVVVATVLMPTGTQLFVNGTPNDVAGNYTIFAFVVICVPAAVYLLSRRTSSTFILLLLASLACCLIQFMYRDWSSNPVNLAISVIAIVGVLTLFIYQRYRQSAYAAEHLKNPSFGKALAFAGIIGIVCAGVGTILFFFLVAPLNLSTPEIKLQQEYYARPIVKYKGVYDNQQVTTPEEKTHNTNDTENDTQDNEEENSQSSTSDGSQESSLASTTTLLDMIGFNAESWQEAFQTIGYNVASPVFIASVLLVVLLASTLVLARRAWRLRRLKKIADWPVEKRVRFLYGFLVDRFEMLGIRRARHLTPLEFAFAAQRDMVPFTKGTGKVDFIRVTLLYQRAAFSSMEISPEEYAHVEAYYRAFFKNARSYVGARRWIFLFWRI